MDNWSTGGAGYSPKLPNSLEEYQFSGILFQGQLEHRARPGISSTERMADFSHNCCVDRPSKFLVQESNLEKQVEREGSMD